MSWFSGQSQAVIFIRTGDRKGAGTNANVTLILHDESGNKSQHIQLDKWFRDDLERGAEDEYQVTGLPEGFGEIKKIELCRDNYGLASNWHVDLIRIDDHRSGEKKAISFPLQRWIKADKKYIFEEFDSKLPQHDQYTSERKAVLDEAKRLYELVQKVGDSPAQVKNMPDDESFSEDYKFDLAAMKIALIAETKLISLTTIFDGWDSLEDIEAIYQFDLEKPSTIGKWKDDVWFGSQRLNGCNPGLLTLCTEIPSKFGVTDEHVRPFLEGLTINGAIAAKRLFMVDLKILENLPCVENFQVCAPIALFFVNNNDNLVPVAIQLQQHKGPKNPIFLPSDPEYTWLIAKMWYNNADASFHQSCTHLGFTHLMMEGIAVAMHRNLAPSHPMFRLLSSHFLYLIAINTRGLGVLVSEGGWVDKTMAIGKDGMFELIRRGLNEWRLDVDGTLPNQLKARGLDHDGILPKYYYKQDALPIYHAIQKYVAAIVNIYYESDEVLKNDHEIQDFGKELVKPKKDGGVGLLGVYGDGSFTKRSDLILTLTAFIFTCSVSHAAANFSQYEEYAFPPNYPAKLKGAPPTDKKPLGTEDLMGLLPDKSTTFDIMVVTKLLSNRGTNALGDFEVQYLYDPRCVEAAQKFREELKKLNDMYTERNKGRDYNYDYLNPDEVPNSISI